MIRITENDLLLFKYLFEEKVLEREHIKNYIWKNLNNSSINRRLSNLKKAGYLSMVKHPFIQNAKLIFATDKAKKMLDIKLSSLINSNKEFDNRLKYINVKKYKVEDGFDPRRLEHDLVLTESRLKLESLGVKNWYSSNYIYQNKNDFKKVKEERFTLIPDGKFEYKDKKYFYEFDNNNRYRRYKKATTVYKNNLIKNVVFIFNRAKIPKGFKKLLNTRDTNFYYALYSDFEKDKIVLKNIVRGKLIIGSDEN